MNNDEIKEAGGFGWYSLKDGYDGLTTQIKYLLQYMAESQDRRRGTSIQNINNIPLSAFSLGNELNSSVAGNTVGVAPPFPGFFSLWGAGAPVNRALRPSRHSKLCVSSIYAAIRKILRISNTASSME